MYIANRIEHYRKSRDMTMEELGLAIGLPKHVASERIYEYEVGTVIPQPDMVSRMASALHISPYDLSAHVFTCGDDLARSLLILEETGLFEIVPEDDQVCIRFVNPENDECQELLEALKDATFDRMMYGFLDSSSDSTERKVYDGVERYY